MTTTVREAIKNIVFSLNFKVKVDSVEVLAGGKVKIFTKNTLYINKNTLLKNGDVVESYVKNEYFIVKTSNTYVAGQEVELREPKFYEGTLQRANDVITKDNSHNLQPFVYLAEPRKEKKDLDPSSTIYLTAEIRMFFAAPTRSERQVEENHKEVVEIIENGLTDQFTQMLYDRNDLFTNVWDFDVYNHEQYLSETLKKYFGDKSSAVELRFSIGIKKNNYICYQNCKL
jgi:hypothetical protein